MIESPSGGPFRRTGDALSVSARALVDAGSFYALDAGVRATAVRRDPALLGRATMGSVALVGGVRSALARRPGWLGLVPELRGGLAVGLAWERRVQSRFADGRSWRTIEDARDRLLLGPEVALGVVRPYGDGADGGAWSAGLAAHASIAPATIFAGVVFGVAGW
ncbi:hypothetical protein L6R52_36910 [Myxococcota bacterium]|nr:hypothetical protein [Myxococcota bacterium]